MGEVLTVARIDNRLILLSPYDNVVVARCAIDEGEILSIDGEKVVLAQAVTLGHKLARRKIQAGEKILKYGAPIGSATTSIPCGAHVHLHNIKSDYTATHSLTEAQAEYESGVGQ